MSVLMFQPRFAPLVADGRKPHTIRPVRKRPIKLGERLSLRRWTGAAYRSKQEVLREATCLYLCRIEVRHHDGADRIIVDGHVMPWDEAGELAVRDGFESLPDMIVWFHKTHGLPFVGTLIGWAKA